MAKVLSCNQVIEQKQVPVGVYRGTWGGYTIKFSAHGNQYEGVTDTGIRTPKAACNVIVAESGITVECPPVSGVTENHAKTT